MLALVLVRQTFWDSFSSCQRNSVFMWCSPAQPLCNRDGVALSAAHSWRVAESYSWLCTGVVLAPHWFRAHIKAVSCRPPHGDCTWHSHKCPTVSKASPCRRPEARGATYTTLHSGVPSASQTPS